MKLLLDLIGYTLAAMLTLAIVGVLGAVLLYALVAAGAI